jgi:cytoskeletal protein CcmA (bactofilin family)
MLEPKDNFPQKSAPAPAPANQQSAPRPATLGTMEQATIGRSLFVKGEITGSESLYVDGRVEGVINLPDNRVTIGRNGNVTANIMAKEVVVMGKVKGNLNVTDRVDLRGEGSVIGDVAAQRLSIEDGAFIKGSIDLGKAGQKSQQAHANAGSTAAPSHEKAIAVTAGSSANA